VLPLKAQQYAIFALRNPWMLTLPPAVRNYVAYRWSAHRIRIEPLLNADLVEICRIIKADHHVVSVNTNGVLLPRQLDTLVAAGVDMLNVSHYDENAAALADILPSVARRVHAKLLKVIGRADVEDPSKLNDVLALARRSGCPRVFFANTYPHVDGLAADREPCATATPRGTAQAPITDADTRYPAVRAELTRRYHDVRMD
jgi:hypothetical protein